MLQRLEEMREENMLIKHRIYIVALILIFFSSPVLIISIINKNPNVSKKMITLTLICILYLVIDILILGSVLNVGVGLEILLFYTGGIISGVIYIISMIINIVKKYKYSGQLENVSASTPKCNIIALVIILPFVFISSRVIRDLIVVKNSDMILVFYSSGNGTIGSGEYFAYAVKDDNCRQFDLCIDYNIEKILPDDFEKFGSRGYEDSAGGYKVYVKNSVIRIWNGEKKIFEYDHPIGRYYNISLKEAYIKK